MFSFVLNPVHPQVSEYQSSHQLTTNQWNLRLKFCLWSPRQLHSRNKSLLPQTLHWESGIYSLPLKCWACRDHGCPTHPQPVVVSPDKVLGDPEMTDSAVPSLEKVTSLKKKCPCSLCSGTCRYTLCLILPVTTFPGLNLWEGNCPHLVLRGWKWECNIALIPNGRKCVIKDSILRSHPSPRVPQSLLPRVVAPGSSCPALTWWVSALSPWGAQHHQGHHHNCCPEASGDPQSHHPRHNWEQRKK